MITLSYHVRGPLIPVRRALRRRQGARKAHQTGDLLSEHPRLGVRWADAHRESGEDAMTRQPILWDATGSAWALAGGAACVFTLAVVLSGLAWTVTLVVLAVVVAA